MSFALKSKLPRLPPEYYRGRAVVFWTHTFVDRAHGWLDAEFHFRFREAMLHAGARYELACPLYVLMPDHWHFLWMGLHEGSDQLAASAFLRKHLRPFLRGCELQDRPHDHVLREHERGSGAFAATCAYVRANPVRAGLVASWRDWPMAGAIVPGYPDLDTRADLFWEKYWKIYYRLLGRGGLL